METVMKILIFAVAMAGVTQAAHSCFCPDGNRLSDVPGILLGGMSEVHEAAAAGDSTQIELLLDTGKYDVNGADPEWQNRTPIHWAAIKGHSESMRLLVEYGAKVDVVTDVGWTPAHFAAEGGRLLALRALHQLGANLDRPDIYGDSPRRVAEINGQTECVAFLEKAEMELREKRAMEAAKKFISFAKFLGKKRPEPDHSSAQPS